MSKQEMSTPTNPNDSVDDEVKSQYLGLSEKTRRILERGKRDLFRQF